MALPPIDVLEWLRSTGAAYDLDVVALYRRKGEHDWPIVAGGPEELERKLERGGHLLPLPQEPAALANILEVSMAGFILRAAEQVEGAVAVRGAERGYPDIELSGPAFAGRFHAVDLKVARRATRGRRTQSRITLYTGNTYFRWPELRWPGMLRPFGAYASHLVVIVVYTLDAGSLTRAKDLEVIVQPSWRIASRQRSSTTREYIGAVDDLVALREGGGSSRARRSSTASGGLTRSGSVGPMNDNSVACWPSRQTLARRGGEAPGRTQNRVSAGSAAASCGGRGRSWRATASAKGGGTAFPTCT